MLKRLYKVIPYFLLALGVAIITAIIDGMLFVKMMGILDLALAKEMDKFSKEVPVLLVLALILVPFGILVAMTKSLYTRKANILVKQYYVSGVFGKNIAEFQKENTGKYISSLTNDFDTLETNLIESIYVIGNALASFGVGVWVLYTVDSWMIIIALIVVVVNIIVSQLTSKPIDKAFRERSDMFEGYTSYIKEVLYAFHIIKNNNLQEKVTDDYTQKSEAIQHKGFIIEKLISYIYSIESLFYRGVSYGVLCIVGYLAIIGRITIGGALLAFQGLQKMAWPLMQASEVFPKLFTSKALIKKIEVTLKNLDNHIETEDLESFQESIVLKDVEFGYEDDDLIILQDVNLEIKKGGKYLIVGPSGGGKSTLLKLLRKYFNPTSGNIQIDGKNLKDIKKEQYFSLVANVEQQVFIFEDTLKNNITLYKEYSDEEINRALKAAGLTDFVEGLPEGLQTIIYDNGKNISGGERSRVVIARAMLNKASILFMDEAFASLDMERAKEIEKTILDLEDITVINVSHVIFKDTKDRYDRVLSVKKTVH
ncbi:MAG: transporter related [Clostridiales bacterium]|jgi:ABC-type multidrug transport system fused ATPase/permease subunit|nr:transporter related [Clostridiales bacterium]